MTTIEVKNQVIKKIKQLDDKELLMDVYRLLDDSFQANEIFRLSDKHKMAIEKAIGQINNGDFLTNEQADKEIEEWLNG